jgi:protein SCO1/2
MRNKRRETFALLAMGVAAAVAPPAAVAVGQKLSGDSPLSETTPFGKIRAERARRHFPNVPLRTHDGRDVRFYDDLVKGKKVLINFTYTNCTRTCPRTTENLRRVQEMLGDRIGRDIFFVSLSLDPERDTPETLRMYAAHNGARPGWTFATGRSEDIDDIRRRLGLYDSPDYTQHMGLFTFGNEAEGKWAVTYALDKPENIVFNFLRRVDPFKFERWPETPTSAAARGSDRS